MKKSMIPGLVALMLFAGFRVYAQSEVPDELPIHYGELTAPDFIKAVEKSGGTCLIPAGILEKHGPHLPLATDLFLSREVSSRAAELEYTIVFPQYYFGQIFEARHQPGTMAYSPELVWKILEETCEELSRNGIKKIIIVNGHGGNTSFFTYFCQSQLAARKDYVVVLFEPSDEEISAQVSALRETDYGGHADEVETSMLYVVRPDLVHADRASTQSGVNQGRIDQIPNAYTGIWWYARYPNHYAGDGSAPGKEIGELSINNEAQQLANLISVLKEDNTIGELQDMFYDSAENPVETDQ